MRNELRAIQKRVGITFIYITHDQGEALTMSDRVAVMNAGVIEQVGDGRSVYDNPRTGFVASFVGENNGFDGTVVVVAGGQAVVDTAVGRLTGAAAAGSRRAARRRVYIRPEALHVANGSGTAGIARERRGAGVRGQCHAAVPDGAGDKPITVLLSRREDAADLAAGRAAGAHLRAKDAVVLPAAVPHEAAQRVPDLRPADAVLAVFLALALFDRRQASGQRAPGFIARNGWPVSIYLIVGVGVWMFVLIVFPQLYMVDYSFHPKLPAAARGGPRDVYTLENYRYFLFGSTSSTSNWNVTHLNAFWLTIVMSIFITILNFAICYPLAYFLAQVAGPGVGARLHAAADHPLLGQRTAARVRLRHPVRHRRRDQHVDDQGRHPVDADRFHSNT